MPITEHIIHQ